MYIKIIDAFFIDTRKKDFTCISSDPGRWRGPDALDVQEVPQCVQEDPGHRGGERHRGSQVGSCLSKDPEVRDVCSLNKVKASVLRAAPPPPPQAVPTVQSWEAVRSRHERQRLCDQAEV